MEEYLQEMQEDFKKCIAAYQKGLGTVRTGRASPVLLESVQVLVSSYNATMGLNQLASVTVSDARTLVVNPWDKTTLNDIDRAIRASGLGLNPNSDGAIIRVHIPPLTGERRQELIRKVRQMAEDARIRARAIRKEYNDIVKDAENEKEISEDQSHSYQKTIQDDTNTCVKDIDQICKDKEAELLEV